MSNQYLPSNFDPTGSYELPLFEDNMVLRASQLNNQFGFLLSHDQATRTQLLGVGVAAGLRPSYSGGTITITAGFGVTTDGDLLRQEVRTYSQYVPFVASPAAAYPPLTGSGAPACLELVTTVTDNQVPRALTSLSLSDYVVVLYQELKLQTADTCTGVACDQGGSEYVRTLRTLLVPKSAAVPRLLRSAQQDAANAYTLLPALTMRRLNPTATNTFYQTRLNTGFSVLSSAGLALRDALDQATTLLSSVDGMLTTGGLSAVSTWKSKLLTKINANRYDINQQYVYNWLKDLYEAYEEFRQATAQWLVNSSATADAFPQHLVLGELTPAPATAPTTPYRYTHRHPWLRSAAVDGAPDARTRALWLFRRIGYLIEGFVFEGFAASQPEAVFKSTDLLLKQTDAAATSDAAARYTIGATGTTGAADLQLAEVTGSNTLRITPDFGRTSSFDQRSLPFYYPADGRTYWSYARAVAGRTQDIYSYHRATSGAAANPLIYQVEPYNFFRVEGLLGLPIGTALDQIMALRRTHNLAFDVVAVRNDDKQLPLIDVADPKQYTDLEQAFAAAQVALRAAVNANNRRVVALPSGTEMQVQKVQLQSDAVEQALAAAVPATLSRQQRRVVKQAQQLALTQLTTSDAASLTAVPTVTTSIAPVTTYQWMDQLSEPDMVLTAASTARDFAGKVSTFKDQDPPLNLLNLLVPITDIWAQYQARQVSLRALIGQLTLPALLAQNPGLEAGAGVPRGGTLVLVYSTGVATPAATDASFVVADYYLPYQLVSANDAPIQFVLNPEAPTGGGNPPPQEPAEPSPTVMFEKPVVVYEKEENGRRVFVADFYYGWKNAAHLLWSFGDGTVETVALETSSSEEDMETSHSISHTYYDEKPRDYLVTVTAFNDSVSESLTLNPEQR